MTYNNPSTAKNITSVVNNGLCIGCGLCESVTGGRVRMQMSDKGSLRPDNTDHFSDDEERLLLAACPGVSVSLQKNDASSPAKLHDVVWGDYISMQYAWASDADIRFRAATGGVLTALGVHLLKTQQVNFVLQIKSDEAQPCRNRFVMSRTPTEIVQATASRYAPSATLAGLHQALETNEPFAVIAKPCDISAVNNLAQVDERVNQSCLFRLSLVCGGQSRFSKTQAFLNDHGVAESDVTVFRYRGYGNPGRTRMETKDGRAFEKTYPEMWGDENQWDIETRCKFCPDALGEGADVTAADVWADANPTGEDAGINGIVVYSQKGQSLVQSATSQGDLTVGDAIEADVFSSFQPHQVSKKQAMQARYDGLQQCNRPIIAADCLRLDTLAKNLNTNEYQQEKKGTIIRAQKGKFDE